MAYVFDPNMEDEQDPNAPPQLAGSSQIVGGASQTQAQTPGAAPRGSDKYQNLQSYLNVGGGDFGGQFAGKVLGESAEAGKQIEQSANQFKGQVDQSKVNANPDLVNRAIADPSKFVEDKANVEAFAKQRDAQYKGPSSFGESPDLYNRAYGATQKAVSSARAAQTEPGRFSLLDTYFGKPQYSQGQKALDNLLLSGDQNAEQGIRQAKENALAQQSNLANKSNQLSNYAAEARGLTEAARNQARGAVGLGEGGQLTEDAPAKALYRDIESRVGGINKANETQYNKDLESLRRKQLTSDQAKRLGINDKVGDYTYGLSPEQYLSRGENASIQTAATKEEQAKIAALSKLAGIENTLLPESQSTGTYNPQDFERFNAEKYNKDIADQSAALEDYLKSTKTYDPSGLGRDYYQLSKLLNEDKKMLGQKNKFGQPVYNDAVVQQNINELEALLKPYEEKISKAKGSKLQIKS